MRLSDFRLATSSLCPKGHLFKHQTKSSLMGSCASVRLTVSITISVPFFLGIKQCINSSGGKALVQIHLHYDAFSDSSNSEYYS